VLVLLCHIRDWARRRVAPQGPGDEAWGFSPTEQAPTKGALKGRGRDRSAPRAPSGRIQGPRRILGLEAPGFIPSLLRSVTPRIRQQPDKVALGRSLPTTMCAFTEGYAFYVAGGGTHRCMSKASFQIVTLPAG